MREIKFRAWDIEKKGMILWEEIVEDWVIAVFLEDYLIIMQYTGLKDKNGKEIYEEDIVQASDAMKTKFKIILCCWGLVGIKEGGVPTLFNAMPYEETLLFDTVPNWEVIGNIYENPELFQD